MLEPVYKISAEDLHQFRRGGGRIVICQIQAIKPLLILMAEAAALMAISEQAFRQILPHLRSGSRRGNRPSLRVVTIAGHERITFESLQALTDWAAKTGEHLE